eukprot:1665747-Rhodomonas_salina.1
MRGQRCCWPSHCARLSHDFRSGGSVSVPLDPPPGSQGRSITLVGAGAPHQRHPDARNHDGKRGLLSRRREEACQCRASHDGSRPG